LAATVQIAQASPLMPAGGLAAAVSTDDAATPVHWYRGRGCWRCRHYGWHRGWYRRHYGWYHRPHYGWYHRPHYGWYRRGWY
jgi:hypothetical protein